MARRIIGISFSIFAAIFIGCAGGFSLSGTAGISADRPWSAVRGDCAGWAFRGRDTGAAEIIWRAKTKVPILAAPVAGDGAIFVGLPTRRILAFDAKSGKRLGKLWADVALDNGLAYSDGLLAITGRSDYNRLRVFDTKSGAFLWSKNSDRAYAAPIVCGKRLFFSTAKGAVFAIDARSGEKIWRRSFDKAVVESEPAFRDSLLYIADSNGRLFAIAADSGAVRWGIDLPSQPVGQPVVIPDHVIVPTASGRIPVIQLDGHVRVYIDAPGELATDIACSGPTVYGVTRKGIVFAADLGGGGILWQTTLGVPVIAPPVLWGKQLAVVTAEGELKLLFYSDGAIEHTIDIGAPVTAPPIVYDSMLYIATETGELVAVGRIGQSMERENGN